jgi:3-methyladenine DNA glycosylase AlkD
MSVLRSHFYLHGIQDLFMDLLTLAALEQEMKNIADPEQAKNLSRFFKTGPGEYGEGDIFLGIKVPVQRQFARKYRHLPLRDIETLLGSEFHEHRLTALIMLGERFKSSGECEKKSIYEFYLRNTAKINNWDLVDLSAPNIVGKYLLENQRERAILYRLVKSGSVWDRRIAVLATFSFIKDGQFDDALKIASLLLEDRHDLIHKAVGWMLREVGKRDQGAEELFLQKHKKHMPRTALRYAIERFSAEKKRFYMD